MDERRFRKLLRRTVAVPVILLALLACTLVVEIVYLTKSLRWVDHTDQVIAEARALMRYMVEAEGDLRGFYLTKDAAYLQAFTDSRTKVMAELETIQELTADNGDQQRRLDEIRDFDLRWIDQTERLVKDHPEGVLDAKAFAAERDLMEQIRAKQREILDNEDQLRISRVKRAATWNRIVLATAIALVLLIAILLFTVTRRELVQLSGTYESHLQVEAERTKEVREGREWFRITLNSLGDAVIATDAAGKVSFINSVAQKLTGWSDTYEARGRPLHDVLQIIDERNRTSMNIPIDIARYSEKTFNLSNHVALVGRDGRELPIELSGSPILNDRLELAGIVIVFRDIAQRRQTEQTLRSNERLALAGRLSATIAHEIRNPLDTVSNVVYLLQRNTPAGDGNQQFLQIAADELYRITQITSQLLTFHRESQNPVQVDLSDTLDSVLTLFAPQLKKAKIEVVRRFDTSRTVRGYPGELRQVFSNLVGNSIDAMPNGGKLTLHLFESSVANDSARRGLRVSLIDSGSGIPSKVRKNLFAPFYTTKGERGTGLGLWISRGLVEKHEGTIHLSSTDRPGRSGTAFSVFLPFEQMEGMLDEIPTPPAA